MPDPSVDPHRLQALLTHCVDFAQLMLSKSGEFFPFGAKLGPDGALGAVAVDLGEHPQPAAMVEALHGLFEAQFKRGEIQAAGVAANVDIPAEYGAPFPDGIRVLIECQGYARFFYLPYRVGKATLKDRLLGRRPAVEYGEFISVELPPSLCAPPAA